MKKIFKTFLICLILLNSFILYACEVETQDGGTKLYDANISSWYQGTDEIMYLDTSVKINFDEINILEIKKIIFKIYDNENVIGSAISEGKNLTSLLQNCATYWDKTPQTYNEVTGERILSCAFRTREEAGDNGYWVRSKCSATTEKIPNKLVVTILLKEIKYETVYSKIITV